MIMIITTRSAHRCLSLQSKLLQTPSFGKFLRGHVRTVPGNMQVKVEVRSFNRFKLV